MPIENKMNVINNDKIKIITGILFRFFVLYVVFFLIYEFLLKQTQPDFITETVASMVNFLYRLSGYDTFWQVAEGGKSIGIFLPDQRWVVKVVEGCNGMSVIILNLAFVLAVPVAWKKRIIFGFVSSLLIFLANLLRIYWLGLIYVSRPGWFDFSHRVLFPAFIYGITVLIWFVYIRKAASDGIAYR